MSQVEGRFHEATFPLVNAISFRLDIHFLSFGLRHLGSCMDI